MFIIRLVTNKANNQIIYNPVLMKGSSFQAETRLVLQFRMWQGNFEKNRIQSEKK